MKTLFLPLSVVTAALFAWAPLLIANAPFESTMGLIQKIFYFHVPAWMAMYSGLVVCGVASALYLFRGRPEADRVAVSAAELTVVFGLVGLVTGPLWARKAWGIWWEWEPRLTMALLLELIFVGYLMVRKYGGPGSEKLAAAVGIFGTAVSPFVYVSVNIWRTIHPKTSVVPELPRTAPEMVPPFAVSSLAFILLFVLMLMARIELARRQATLDELYLAHEDSGS
ncbi:MAG: cytochrome c biogenesis protein CcsA [Acidobacteria bacterium]|nr:cytochrome c biogenesis protein CcsA [Acidobacteriota bacterium]